MACCGCIGNCLGGIFKYIIFIFNLLFVLAGIAIMVLGILIQVRFFDLSDYTSIDMNTSALIMTIGGGVIIVVAFMGCCGAISNKKWMLNMYAALLLVAFALQIAGAVIVFVWNPEVNEQLEKDMKNLMSLYPISQGENGESGEKAKTFWDHTQANCCGIRSRLDWGTYRPGLTGLPESCKCVAFDYLCDDEGYFKTGCFYGVKDAIFDLAEVLAWVAMGVAIFELSIGTLTLIYANAKKEKHGSHQHA